MAVDPREFCDALGCFASGVTVVSAVLGGERRGMTASAFVSVSLQPPLILVGVDRRAHLHDLLERGDKFTVSVLAEGQRALSDHFAGRPDEGLRVPWEDLDGLPVIGGAVAQLACAKHRIYDGGDHTLFVGEVLATRTREGEPLAYYRGRYRALGAS